MITDRSLYPEHDSHRGVFARELYFAMQKEERIMLFTGDLGYGMFDLIRDHFPDRFINVGAAEQCLVGAGIGAVYAGKIPFVYSITPFLLFRGIEWIRNYVQHERVPLRMVGGGFEDDYKHDGRTHHAYDTDVLKVFKSIHFKVPEKHQIPDVVDEMISLNEPYFICLRR